MGFSFDGSLVAIVTPMTAAGDVDLPAWERLVHWHAIAGTGGLVVGGTTGESATLTETEVETLVRSARALFPADRPIIAGSGTNSTATSIARGARFAAAGADALLAVTPYYNKPTQEGLIAHYTAIGEASPVPVILYNVPGRTAVDLKPATVAALAGRRNLVAIKESTMSVERIAELVRLVAGRMVVLAGDDPVAAGALLAGARGVISVTANVAPRRMRTMVAAALSGDARAAHAIDATLAPLHEALFVEPNPIPSKWALQQMGLIGPGIRLPLTPLSAEAQASVSAALLAAALDDAE